MTGEIGEKPACVKTHLRNVVVIPEMVGSVIGIYNGKGEWFAIFNPFGSLNSKIDSNL